MRKKIAFLIYDTSLTGGAEVITKQLANDINSLYDVTLISIFQEKDITHKGYRHVILSKETKSITKNIFYLSKSLRKILKDLNIQILFSVTAGVNSVAVYGARKTSTKVVFVEHSNLMNQTYGKKHFLRQKIGARKSSHIVTLTEADKENYMRILNIPSEKISVIPNWFEQCESHTSYDIHSKKIITAGRLVKIKGYDTLLEVASKVFSKFPDWSWDIFGEGDQRDYIYQIICNKNLEKNVFLKGNVSNLPELYPNYAMFVMCSYYEGLPLVLLEAQVASLPLISFDCQTGPKEIILDKVNGNLIKERDVDEMAKSIITLISQPDVRLSYAKHAKDALYRFNKEEIRNKWLNLIEQLN